MSHGTEAMRSARWTRYWTTTSTSSTSSRPSPQPQPRSEEHTSELQSLPTRRSSDLVTFNVTRHGGYEERTMDEVLDHYEHELDKLTPFPPATAQIGRAHV